MADIQTSQEDEKTIDLVLAYGFDVHQSPRWPKYIPLRLALAKSMQVEAVPSSEFDKIDVRGSEYGLQQLTGFGLPGDEDGSQDFDDAIRALLSILHQDDFFSDQAGYRTWLQRHVRRGLKDIRTSWRRGDNFISWMEEELFSGVNQIDLFSHDDINAETIITALKEIGVKAEIQQKIQGPRIDRYQLQIANIRHFDILTKGLDKLGFLLGLDKKGVFLQATNEPKVIGLDVPRQKSAWKIVQASNISQWASNTDSSKLEVWLGHDVLGNDVQFDLTEAPHVLVAGTTGSGKSITLHAILLSLLWSKSADELQVALIDPKLVELKNYQKIPHLYGEGVAHSINESMDLLEDLIIEMERRNQLLSEVGAANLQEALHTNKLNLPKIVVVIEELADLMMESKDIETPLVRLAQKARSTGIHLVLATQRPDAATFTGLLRSNIPGRIALRVQKSSESKIILDNVGAEKLLGSGDMLVKISSGEAHRVHGAYITTDDIKSCIKHIRRE